MNYSYGLRNRFLKLKFCYQCSGNEYISPQKKEKTKEKKVPSSVSIHISLYLAFCFFSIAVRG